MNLSTSIKFSFKLVALRQSHERRFNALKKLKELDSRGPGFYFCCHECIHTDKRGTKTSEVEKERRAQDVVNLKRKQPNKSSIFYWSCLTPFLFIKPQMYTAKVPRMIFWAWFSFLFLRFPSILKIVAFTVLNLVCFEFSFLFEVHFS